jgi:peptidyl-prolyl cis-trans isomerase SurA
MMKLGWLPRAAIVLIAPVLSMVAAAQSGAPSGQLDIPSNIQFVGKQDPGIRKATAIVNGEVITGSDVDHRVALVVASNPNAQPSAEELERIRAQVLRNLIDESLEVQEAARQDIIIGDPDVNAYVQRIAGNFHRTPEAFVAYLHSIGSSDQSLKRQIRAELAWQRLRHRVIDPFVNVGDDEVQAVIARLNASRGASEYHVAEIFMSATPETLTQVQANAANIARQIRGGANFQAYARQFSEASTAATGGDLGWVRAEQLPDELAGVIQQMPVGAISDPIAVPGGVSIVALADKRQILVADPRDAVLSLMQMSITLPAGTTRAQAEARGQQMATATQAMGGCGHAQATAQTLGGEVVVNDQVALRQLPPALQQMLLGLSVGQVTQPFGTAERLSVLVLCGRDDPPAATAPNPDEIMTRIEEERSERRAQRFLRDLRRDAVVDYR